MACMGDRKGAYRGLVGRPEGKRPLVDLDLDVKIILKCIFNKWDGETYTGLSWLRIGQMAGYCECGNEPSDYIQCGNFFDWLRME